MGDFFFIIKNIHTYCTSRLVDKRQNVHRGIMWECECLIGREREIVMIKLNTTETYTYKRDILDKSTAQETSHSKLIFEINVCASTDSLTKRKPNGKTTSVNIETEL